MPTTTRVFNFSAGPAVLPFPVLEQAQRDLVALPGVGMSVMEISHRSKVFEDLARGRDRGNSGAGGRSLELSDPVSAGWRESAVLDGADESAAPGRDGRLHRHGHVGSESDRRGQTSRNGERHRFDQGRQGTAASRPSPSFVSRQAASYVHITTNNTIEGTEWKTPPDVADVPLVADASSDILSGPIDVGRFGVIYAGAQKNLGPSGVTLVMIREDLLARSDEGLPTMLSYKVQAENNSLYNTPNTFGIYILGLVTQWLKSLGGLSAIARINQRKAAMLYSEIDRTGFYRGTAQKESRSLMNVTFRLPSEDLEKTFDRQASAAGFDGLKGHRSVGGLRASIYNAFPEEGVAGLVDFMREFERTHG